MPLTDPDLDVVRKINDLMARGPCTAFIGSGPSTPLYPNWPTLLMRLAKDCGLSEEEFSEQELQHRPFAVAEKCKCASESTYKAGLHDVFGRDPVGNMKIYDYLMKMSFADYITLNFDPLLADAFYRIKGDSQNPSAEHDNKIVGHVYYYPDLPASHLGTESLFHLHRSRDTQPTQNSCTFVLAQSDFDGAYQKYGTVPALLTNVLTYSNVLFIGCSISEPELHEALKVCQELQSAAIRAFDGQHQPEKPKWLMLSPDAKAGQKQDRTDLGIEIITYDPRDEAHSGLVDIFQAVAKVPDVERRIGSGLPGGGP